MSTALSMTSPQNRPELWNGSNLREPNSCVFASDGYRYRSFAPKRFKALWGIVFYTVAVLKQKNLSSA